MTEQEKFVLSEIIRITKDNKSRSFWKKAIKILGANRTEMELGELKHQMRIGEIKNPASYLTHLLKEQLNQIEQDKTLKNLTEIPKTHYEKTQQNLFKHLTPVEVPKQEPENKKFMPFPYSGKNIPWPTFIGPEFFTLSTNKARSDSVMYKPHTKEKVGPEVPLIRGKISPDAKKEYGIPTIQHWRVFSALKVAWAEKGCQFSQYSNGTLVCFVVVSAKELAKILGWKHWQHLGKNNLRWLRDTVTDLKSMPYYLQLEKNNIRGLKGYGFYLVGDVSLLNKKVSAGDETLFNVSFSSTVSYQLLERHAVIRTRKMLQVQSELTSLIWLYLEPNLRANNEACINLENLVEVLHLPKSKWQKYQSKRKQIFSKSIKELDGQKLADGRSIHVKIEKGLNDYQMVANLMGISIKQLENHSV